MNNMLKNHQILSINELMRINLNIPDYQRPYKWKSRNITTLLTDIDEEVRINKDSKQKYRLGTVILHKNNNVYDIVDGQQRIISLILIKLFLEDSINNNLLENNFKLIESQKSIYNNYRIIKDFYSTKNDNEKNDIKQAFNDIFEVVVFVVDEISEAFQLFDSQNTRGKELIPQELLKAYHLRKMENEDERKKVVTEWEAVDRDEIQSLLSNYMFPIKRWASGESYISFTNDEIDTYKGVDKEWKYPYSKLIIEYMPNFQICNSFESGKNFFIMIQHYLKLKKDALDKSLKIMDSEMKDFLNIGKSTGFEYAKELFECAIICYYDRFGKINKKIINKFFTWAFMLRVNMEVLPRSTINKYALGEENEYYTNHIPMFTIITQARKDTDLYNVVVNTDSKRTFEKWNDLHKYIERINNNGSNI